MIEPSRVLVGLFSLVACSALGCAGVSYQRDLGQTGVKGIRYLDVSPYILLNSSPDGALAVKLLYLPDPNRKMAAQPTAKGAKADLTLEFNDGALSKASGGGDATVVPQAILDAATTVLSALDEVGEETSSKYARHTFPGPRIYKVLVLGDRVRLIGDNKSDQFEISLVPQKDKESKK